MTALTFSASSHEPTATTTKRTLKSIKKYSSSFLAKDNSNPLTLHSVNEDLFPRFWSLMAEVMYVKGSLETGTKESISWLINNQNGIKESSPKPKKASTDDDPFAKAAQNEAIKYADRVLLGEGKMEDSSRMSHSRMSQSNTSSYVTLSRGGRAEAALVVLLFTHLNRTGSALLAAEDLASAMASVSNGGSAPSTMDLTSPKRAFKSVNRMVRTPQPNKPGITATLFEGSAMDSVTLPEHLQGAGYAGSEVTRALARLVSWVETYQEKLLSEGILTSDALALLECTEPPASNVSDWVSSPEMVNQLKSLPNQAQIAARVLLLVSHAPASVSGSRWWTALHKAMGKEEATSVVLWWSLRLALQQARGLYTGRRHGDESSSHGKSRSRLGYHSI